MKKLKIFQVDAFTESLFSGNPAAVCPLEEWPEDELLQDIATENNLSETAFFKKTGKEFEIRWFTPTIEVDLCGHATLASAFVIFNIQEFPDKEIIFHSPRSGILKVFKKNNLLYLDFPTDTLEKIPTDYIDITGCIHLAPEELFKGKDDYIAVLNREEDIRNLQPELSKIEKLDSRGLIVTAPGEDCDFVSRYFGPQCGIPEDPVTGSAHTSLTPIWSVKTGKLELTARQLSKRGGFLLCEYHKDRCHIGGNAILYMSGELNF